MYTKINNSKMPKWIKILICIVLTITLIYWIGVLIYKILDGIRRFIHWSTEPRNWWTFLVCVMILLVGSLLIAQFSLGLDPIGKVSTYITEKFNVLRDNIANLIKS